MTEVKLAPCGCGGEARVRHGKDSACWWVECPNCGISTLWHLRFSEADAVEAWNLAMSGHDHAEVRPEGVYCKGCGYRMDES